MQKSNLPETTIKKLEDKAHKLTDIFWQLVQETKPITEAHIADHEGKWPIEKQYLKVYEEVGEAQKAYERNYDDKDEEHLDIIFASLTLHHFYNMSKDDIFSAIYLCLIKFEAKGWMDKCLE